MGQGTRDGAEEGRNKKGLTLVETLIYVALFSIITSFVLVVFYQVVGSQVQDRNRSEIESDANFIMQKIIWGLSGAQTINQPAAGATSTTLSVNKFNFSQNPVVFTFATGTVSMSRGGNPVVPLGSSKLTVNQLVFQHLPAVNNQPEGVSITLSVSYPNTGRAVTPSTTLVNTVYLIQ